MRNLPGKWYHFTWLKRINSLSKVNCRFTIHPRNGILNRFSIQSWIVPALLHRSGLAASAEVQFFVPSYNTDTEICRRLGCVIPYLTYNLGSRNLSFDLFDISVNHFSCSIRFDLAVNGGGAVTLQFQRSPLRAATRTTSLPWNAVVTLNPVVSSECFEYVLNMYHLF